MSFDWVLNTSLMICCCWCFFQLFLFQVETVVLSVWMATLCFLLASVKSKTSRFYFTTGNYVFYKSLFTFLFCVFQNKIWNFPNKLSWQFKCIYKIYLFRLKIHPEPFSGELNKCSFKINMFAYLIMTVLLNTIVCSMISLVGDSCWEENSQLTCRSRLAGFCSMRAATEGYFRADYSSKILLLLNLLFFINVFELATWADHHPTSTMIVQEGYFLSISIGRQ